MYVPEDRMVGCQVLQFITAILSALAVHAQVHYYSIVAFICILSYICVELILVFLSITVSFHWQ